MWGEPRRSRGSVWRRRARATTHHPQSYRCPPPRVCCPPGKPRRSRRRRVAKAGHPACPPQPWRRREPGRAVCERWCLPRRSLGEGGRDLLFAASPSPLKFSVAVEFVGAELVSARLPCERLPRRSSSVGGRISRFAPSLLSLSSTSSPGLPAVALAEAGAKPRGRPPDGKKSPGER
jgi:hypothetical protein